MAAVYDLKPCFQALLRPLVNALAASGVTANQVTIAAVVVSFAGGRLVAWRPVPFFADGFVGEALTWQGSRVATMQALEARFAELERQGGYAAWE